MFDITLQGGINFRAFDGYEMADGRKIRANVLFRSGALAQLTPQDIEKVSSLPVSHILDYRDQKEAMMRPDTLWPDIFYECVPANPSENLGVAPNQLQIYTQDAQEAFDFMCDLYRILPFQNKAYQHLIDWLQNPEVTGIIQHCAIGKDRTGVGSAVLLMTLGASRETIIHDYLKTETSLAIYRARMMALWCEGRSDAEQRAMNCLFSANKKFIVAALDIIHERYGSFEQYLKEEFDLNEKTLADIRVRYLTETA